MDDIASLTSRLAASEAEKAACRNDALEWRNLLSALIEEINDEEGIDDSDWPALERARIALKQSSPAPLAAELWQPIETAPLDVPLLLGWWREWPERVWVCETGSAGHKNDKPAGMSNGWRHGQATHWMPLPSPPQDR